MPRPDGRAADELRPITFERDFTEMAAGSVLVSFGRTRVLCTASVDEDVPRWMRGSGKGWVTAEYSMLPGSSPERIDREAAQGQAVGAHAGDPAPDRPFAARGHRHARCSASGRSSSTATCSRPTAARAPRRSAAATSRCTTRSAGSCSAGRSRRTRSPSAAPRSRVGIVDGDADARPRVRRGLARRGRHERRDDRRRAASSRCRARPRAWRSPAASSTPCSGSPRTGSAEIFALQRELLAEPPPPRRVR